MPRGGAPKEASHGRQGTLQGRARVRAGGGGVWAR